MFKYWFRHIGLPLTIAFIVAGIGGSLENEPLMFVAVAAFLWAGAGGRRYRTYRNARIRHEAIRDARRAHQA